MEPLPRHPANTKSLLTISYLALGAGMLWCWYSARWEDLRLTLAAMGMLALGVMPMIRWVSRHDQAYPIYEFLLLTTVPFYALPLITGHEETYRFRESVLLQAALVVITFQAACIAGNYFASRCIRPRRTYAESWWNSPILNENHMKVTGYTLILTTLWLLVQKYTMWVSGDLLGTFRAIFMGIGTISIFVQSRLLAQGSLRQAEKGLFFTNLSLQVILSISSLLLIQGIGLLLTALAGYFTVRRRVPWLACALVLPILAVLHNGKSEMRKIYWGDTGSAPQVEGLPEFFWQWIQLGLPGDAASAQQEDDETEQLTYGLMRRASLFHLVCVAVAQIPAHRPYLFPDSYSPIPSLFVPRFLWPGKPSPQESVTLLSVHLGILTPEAAKSTSIGFGTLAEAYANNGFLCVAVVGLAFGFALRWLALTTVHCATVSIPGLLRILCIVWCFNAESTLAVWISSLYQATIAIVVPLIAWKKLSSG